MTTPTARFCSQVSWLSARREEPETLLGAAEEDSVFLHSNMAGYCRQQVANLAAASNVGDGNVQNFSHFHIGVVG
jgi:hypothetical protein